jgi:16S rRNA (adenine1518-N6/adenine1519-N6)-dimethyltransferase
MSLAQEISAFCSKHRLKLNTDLGQHFLIDENILRIIVDTANIEPHDHILEIGPGIGVLTRELLKKTHHVTAIELDQKLIPVLHDFLINNQQSIINNLTLIKGNALTIPFPDTPYKIVANIPYHITSPLLRHAFLESKTAPTTMTLLIQKEVAEKICLPTEARSAKVGDTKHYTLLSILVGLFGKPSLIAKVPPEAFLPPPKVDSAVLHIECFDRPKADPKTIENVFRLTKIAFSQKRKMLRNTIGELEGGTEKLMNAGIEETRRPQTLSVKEWIRLAQM